MKNLLISISLFLLAGSAIAQETYGIKFENGETKVVTIDYDNPSKIPQWQVGIMPMTIMVQTGGGLAFQLKPSYRINDKIRVDGRLAMPYGKAMDDNIHQSDRDNENYKLMINASALFTGAILSSDKSKERKVSVDYGYSGNTTTIYNAKLPRVKRTALNGIIGIDYFQSSRSLQTDHDTISDTYTDLASSQHTSVAFGLSLERTQSYEVSTSYTSRQYWRIFRLYGYMTYAFSNNELYVFDNRSNGRITSGNSATNAPTITQIGYRAGFQVNLGAKNSSSSLEIGMEVGAIPGYEVTSTTIGPTTVVPSSSLVLVGFGFTFGGPKKALN